MGTITSLTIAAIFLIGVATAVPLGRLFRIHLTASPYPHIDGMRTIAALLVVCSHAAPTARVLCGGPASAPFIEAMGAVGVHVFFGITAFLFTRKALQGPVDPAALISSRVRRIVPLYVLCAALAIAFALYLSTTLNAPPALQYKDILKAFAFGFVGGAPSVTGVSIAGLLGQAWTLQWEWSFYILVPFVAAISARRPWAVAALLFAGACAFYQLKEGEQVWVFFLPGVLAAMVEQRVSLSAPARGLAFILGVAGYGLSLAIEAKLYGPARLILSTIAFPCLLFGYQGVLALRPLRLLGEVSYSLYMLQLLVITGFWRIATDEFREFFPTLQSKVALGVGMTAAFFVLAFCTYAAVERPFMVRAKRKASQATVISPAGNAHA